AKYTPNGTLAWARSLGGSGLDEGWGIAVDTHPRINKGTNRSAMLSFQHARKISSFDSQKGPRALRIKARGRKGWSAPCRPPHSRGAAQSSALHERRDCPIAGGSSLQSIPLVGTI